MIEWANAGHPVPFNYRSAALDPDALSDRQGDDDENSCIIITP
jgi:hypothetical protein